MLVARARSGDERAFGALVERHQARVYNVALRVLGLRHAAQDVAQDAFVRLSRAIDGIRDASTLQVWLYRVTINLCRDEMRRRRRESRMVPLELVKGSLVSAQHTDDATDPTDARATEVVQGALDQLPRALREVVILRFVSNMSYEDIADALDVPVGTVASRLHRALRRIGRSFAVQRGSERAQ